MELSWVNKLRIAAVAALGIVVIGFWAWPVARPEDPLLPVRASELGLAGTLVLLAAAFALGLVGYYLSWPHGREIGILTVPFGLSVWALRSGPMRALTQALEGAHEREALIHSLSFEPLYWLLVVAAGFGGVLTAQHLRPAASKPVSLSQIRGSIKTSAFVNVVVALAAATLIAHLFIGVFARDLTTSYNPGAAQPAVGQIVFAVVAAFALAAFTVKKVLNLSYLCPAIASAFVIAFSAIVYYGPKTAQEFAETRPATVFPHSSLTVLPLQIVALGALGSVIGYWLAVRYDHWRRHEDA
jgi:hypothetical protein